MGESVESLLARFRKEADEFVNNMRTEHLEKGGRELSLVITQLQQARMWAGEALKEMGFYDNEGTQVDTRN